MDYSRFGALISATTVTLISSKPFNVLRVGAADGAPHNLIFNFFQSKSLEKAPYGKIKNLKLRLKIYPRLVLSLSRENALYRRGDFERVKE